MQEGKLRRRSLRGSESRVIKAGATFQHNEVCPHVIEWFKIDSVNERAARPTPSAPLNAAAAFLDAASPEYDLTVGFQQGASPSPNLCCFFFFFILPASDAPTRDLHANTDGNFLDRPADGLKPAASISRDLSLSALSQGAAVYLALREGKYPWTT